MISSKLIFAGLISIGCVFFICLICLEIDDLISLIAYEIFILPCFLMSILLNSSSNYCIDCDANDFDLLFISVCDWIRLFLSILSFCKNLIIFIYYFLFVNKLIFLYILLLINVS